MNVRHRIIAGCILSLVAASNACAQLPSTQSPKPLPPRIAKAAKRSDGGMDSRATADPRVIKLINEIRRTVPTGLDEAAARQVVVILLEDRQLDMAEYDLLDELTQPAIRAVSLRAADSPDTSVIIGTQSGAVAKILESALDQHVEAMLGNPPTADGWARMLSLAEFSDASELRIRRLLVRQLRERLDQSNMANAYDPLARQIALHFDNNAKLPPERVATGRTFLWMACKDLDNATGDKVVPDFLYDWIRPKR